MNWRAAPLLAPSYYENFDIQKRTAWTPEEKNKSCSEECKAGKPVLKPGEDYIVVEPVDDEYVTFDDEPARIFAAFRHSWVIERKMRPDVVVIDGLSRPSTCRSATENARYCSLFFRPWSLLNGDAEAPHFSLLGCNLEAAQNAYNAMHMPAEKKIKMAGTKIAALQSAQRVSVLQRVDWHRTWEEYVRGNVVSETAASLIESFLLKTIAASGAGEGVGEMSEADASEEEN